VSGSSPTAAASVESPTGPPPTFSTTARNTLWSRRSRPYSSTSNSSSPARARSRVMSPSWCTSAKSRTRLSSRFAMRGVPRERFAIASAPSASVWTPRMPARAPHDPSQVLDRVVVQARL
jgi:hypothetical protein